MRFLGKDTTVLAGHGFDEKGPYLLINDIEKEAQHRFSVRNKTFTMKRLPERYCVGRFDLLTHRKSVCPLRVELLPSEKDGMCPACKEATGFNRLSITPKRFRRSSVSITKHPITYILHISPNSI